ncbi:Asp23/Gls24 family envelope stress response protein [Nocardia speluncae]|uniref:Asp23/Gls24 family envelope stress response protein n=1 Tax=Nocardia speluncae TaxID=419477 RepID=A0A846XGV7_9NOCA|nr:Asp23/Gls24 family envelope stress response protein [Nocardia speluncae]NKY34585.1 Asp23/Gls24 family envelope stress response protein [Nocardia speluncae]
MAVNETTERNHLLPCGRDLDRVWQRLDEGATDAHEATCPHCRAARESLLALRAATRELINEPEEPSPDLLGRIMSAVRADARRGRMLELPAPHAGEIQVSEQAVAVIVRYAADSVPGVRARNCRVRQAPAESGGPGPVDVELTIAVRSGTTSLDEVLPDVRARVAAALPDRIGTTLRRLDLHVGDLYEQPPETGPDGSEGRK